MESTNAERELREVTLEEAMAYAILCQQAGHLADAEEVYRRVLERWPEPVGALHFSGVLAHQQGRTAEGLALIDRSLALDASQADCHNNRGIVLRAAGRLDEAAEAYRRAIEIEPGHANAHCNLGVLLRRDGRFDEAEAEYRKAIAIDPAHIDAHHNLGALLALKGRHQEAVLCFCKVTTLMPSHKEARRLLAAAHCTLGEREKAVRIYEDWIAEEPDSPIARHMLAACSGREVPDRASDEYVERVFDGFASSFAAKLAHLAYRAPDIINALVADASCVPDKTLVVLDAGCGTGLCGPLMAPYARRLTGVDLSGAMLERAAERKVYDELYKSELVAFMRSHPGAFDLIVSADTLVYFGALDEAIAAAAGALREGGVFAFTLEALVRPGAGPGFELQTHGRYCHDRAYVDSLLRGAGLRPEIADAELRMESGVPVAGLAIRASLEGAGRG